MHTLAVQMLLLQSFPTAHVLLLRHLGQALPPQSTFFTMSVQVACMQSSTLVTDR
jgi:hypothetical protein